MQNLHRRDVLRGGDMEVRVIVVPVERQVLDALGEVLVAFEETNEGVEVVIFAVELDVDFAEDEGPRDGPRCARGGGKVAEVGGGEGVDCMVKDDVQDVVRNVDTARGGGMTGGCRVERSREEDIGDGFAGGHAGAAVSTEGKRRLSVL